MDIFESIPLLFWIFVAVAFVMYILLYVLNLLKRRQMGTQTKVIIKMSYIVKILGVISHILIICSAVFLNVKPDVLLAVLIVSVAVCFAIGVK